jgi:hypothetical protein
MGEVVPFPKLYFRPPETEAAVSRLIDVVQQRMRKPRVNAGLFYSIFCGKEDEPPVDRENDQRD